MKKGRIMKKLANMCKIHVVVLIIFISTQVDLVASYAGQSANKLVNMTEQEEQQTNFSMKVGQKFVIELPANPSTGYSWYWLVNEPTKEMPVELIKQEYRANKRLAGSQDVMRFTFQAHHEGLTTIVLYKKRIWQKNSDADMRRYEVNVQ